MLTLSDIPRVVVLGAGYGGLQAALRLEGLSRKTGPLEIILVDTNNYHQLITKLHEVAAGSISPERAIIPLTRLLAGRAINFLQATVEKLHLDEQRVVTSAGEVAYDALVVALGSETEFFGIPGAEESSFTLRSCTDALRIKSQLRKVVATAADEPDEARRRPMLTFVISGGGFTGVELAAELADELPVLARAHGIDPRQVDLLILEAAKDIMPGFPAPLVGLARKILSEKRVTVRADSPVVRVAGSSVEIKGGDALATQTLIWAVGVRCGDLLATSGLQTGVRGRAIVNPYLETVTHLNVYVVGDAALVLDPATGRPVAPSAQLAVGQGHLVGYNIWANSVARPRVAYRPKVLGEVVSLGRRQGLARIRGHMFDGRLAKWLKEFAEMRYLYKIGGVKLLRDYLGLASAGWGGWSGKSSTSET